MSDKKRIIELVEKGVLTTDEALKLLENLAEKEDEKAEELNFENEKAVKKPTEMVEPEKETASEKTTAPERGAVAQEHKKIEETKQADENSEQSKKVKQLTEQKEKLDTEIKTTKAEEAKWSAEVEKVSKELEELTNQEEAKKTSLKTDIEGLEKEIQLIQAMHEDVDTSEELVELFDQLSTKQRELEKAEADQTSQKKIAELNDQLENAKKEHKKVSASLAELKKELHRINMQIWSNKASAAVESLEIPQSLDETVTEAGNVVGSMVTKIGGLVSDTVGKISDTISDIDWEETKNKIQKGATSKTITKEWTFADPEITVLDFKNANGKINFYQTDQDEIHIEAKMRLLGVQEEDIEAALEKRMEIEAAQGKLHFHIPNKRVQARLKIWLPKRSYDYLSLRVLNGEVTFEPLQAKDITLNVTNGKITFDQLEATLLELKGTNGDITLNDTHLRDLIISTVNGAVRVVGDVQSSQISTVNGTIRQTLFNQEIIRITNQTVNGTIKIAVPESIGIEGHAQTTFGNIHTRLSQFEEQPTKKDKVKNLDVMRTGDNYVDLEAKTVSGSIFIKDNEANTDEN